MTGVALTNKTGRVAARVCTRAQISLNFACWGSYSIHFRYFNWEAAACQTRFEVRAENLCDKHNSLREENLSGGKKTQIKLMLLIWNLFYLLQKPHGTQKHQCHSRTIQLYPGLSVCCTLAWKRGKTPNKTTFFIDHCDQTSTPIHPPQLRIGMKAYTLTLEVADLWGPETHKQNLWNEKGGRQKLHWRHSFISFTAAEMSGTWGKL